MLSFTTYLPRQHLVCEQQLTCISYFFSSHHLPWTLHLHLHPDGVSLHNPPSTLPPRLTQPPKYTLPNALTPLRHTHVIFLLDDHSTPPPGSLYFSWLAIQPIWMPLCRRLHGSRLRTPLSSLTDTKMPSPIVDDVPPPLFTSNGHRKLTARPKPLTPPSSVFSSSDNDTSHHAFDNERRYPSPLAHMDHLQPLPPSPVIIPPAQLLEIPSQPATDTANKSPITPPAADVDPPAYISKPLISNTGLDLRRRSSVPHRTSTLSHEISSPVIDDRPGPASEHVVDQSTVAGDSTARARSPHHITT